MANKNISSGPDPEREHAYAQQPNMENLVEKISSLVQGQLDGFRAEILGAQQATMTEVKRIKYAEPPKFKRKSHEEQWKVNRKVLDNLEGASEALEDVTCPAESGSRESFNKAKKEIFEGTKLLNERQKLILLADQSKFGWGTVAEYTQHELAEDSDDEKRIYKAEARARSNKTRGGGNYRGRKRRYHGDWDDRPAMSMVPVVVSTPTSSAATNEAGSKFYGKRTGRCFVCPVARARRENRQVIVAGGHTVAPGESTSMPSGGYKISIDRSIRNVLENTIYHVNVNNVNYISSKVGMSPEGEGKCNLQNVEQDNTIKEGKVIKQQVERLSPVGRLKDRVDQWNKYGSSDFILDIIQDGKILNNIKSSLIYHDFVEEEIAKLLKLGCISESKVSPLVVNPLTVSVNDLGKCRLILDLRYINQYLVIPKFTLEDVAVAKQIFHKGDFLFTFDLQSAYHHLEIADDYKEYLGFSWELNGRKKWFVFNVLPFGLSTGPFIFTKLGRVLVRHWRSEGINIFLYLDDGIGGAASLDRARILSTQVKQDLKNCGFLLSEEKCLCEPKQRAVWLGFEFDTTCGKLFVKCDRVKKLKQWVGKMLNQIQGVKYYSDSGRVGPLVRVRELAGIVGQIISMYNGIGNVAQLRTRSMQWCIETRAGWDSSVAVNEEAFAELKF